MKIDPKTSSYSLSMMTACLLLLFCCKNDPISFSEEQQYFEDYTPPKGKWGFIDPQGRLIIPYLYDAVRDFNQGLCPVNQDGKWGYINTKNQTIIQPNYKAAWPFDGYKALVKTLDNDYIWINQSGEITDSFPHYDEIFPAQYGYSAVRKDGLYGIVNEEGEEILACDYLAISSARYGYFIALDATGRRVYKKDGQPLSDRSFDQIFAINDRLVYADNGVSAFLMDMTSGVLTSFSTIIDQPFISGLAPFSTDDGTGLINLQGYIVVKPKYDEIISAKADKWMAFKNGKVSILIHNGKPLNERSFDMMHQFSEGRAAVSVNDQWGFIDTTGQVVIPIKYNMVWDFAEGRAQIIGDHKVGFITPTDKYIKSTGYIEARQFKEGLCAVQEYK